MSAAKIEFEGSSYDLTDFEHPGGHIIRGAYLTDATALVHVYHPNVERIRKAIEPFRTSKGKAGNADKYKGPLYEDLKKRVHSYLKANNLSTGADSWLRWKMVGLWLWHIASLMVVVFSSDQTTIRVAACSMGAFATLTGMNVMHDASHMAIETKASGGAWWNYVWQLSGDWVGISTIGWRYLHAMQHHVHTDTVEDPDAAFTWPVLRTADAQPHFVHHYVQSLFLPFFAVIVMPLFQLHDLAHTITGYYTFEGIRKPIGTKHTPLEWVHFVVAKAIMFAQYALLYHKGGWPAVFFFSWCGSALLSHVDVPGHYTAHPPLPKKLPKSITEGDVVDNWLLEQLHHTNSFAPSANHLFGGLNMQTEHHLFPRLSHRHYPAIQEILREFCKEHGLPYNEYSFVGVNIAAVKRMVVMSLPPKTKKLL